MLKPEEAKARLEAWHAPDGPDRVKEAVARLADGVRNPLETMLGWRNADESGQSIDYDEAQLAKYSAAIEFDKRTAKERICAFEIVAPALAPTMEAAWQLCKSGPYPIEYEMRSYRAPRNTELVGSVLCELAVDYFGALQRFRTDAISLAWLAAWAPHMTSNGYHFFDETIGVILAAALNESSAAADEVFEILSASLTNRHEIGAPGRHIYCAFLRCNRQEAWSLVEKTLLAAQRQEGLRQAILECVDLSHPNAFRRMLRVILEHGLIRFSSVVRALDVWLGQIWLATNATEVKKSLTQMVAMLDDPEARHKALRGKDARMAYLALWCAATDDAVDSIELATPLLSSKSVEMRYAAATHLKNLGLHESAVALTPLIDDADLRVVSMAVAGTESRNVTRAPLDDDRFERFERLLGRLPAKAKKMQPLVWPWPAASVDREIIAKSLLNALGNRNATRLIPHLSMFCGYDRSTALDLLTSPAVWDGATRAAMLDLAGDASGDVRVKALKALEKQTLAASEILRLEDFLTRKAGNQRRGTLAVLAKQNEAGALDSARRLMQSKDANQRTAGLELLRLLIAADRGVVECRRIAREWEAQRKRPSAEEQKHLAEIAKEKVAGTTLDDALGLSNPADRTPVVPPRNLKVRFITPAAVKCLQSLDAFIHEHRDTPVDSGPNRSNADRQLLGTMQWGFAQPIYDKPVEEQLGRVPLLDLWKEWLAERGRETRDDDGLELVRAEMFITQLGQEYDAKGWAAWANGSPDRRRTAAALIGDQSAIKLRYTAVVSSVLDWLLTLSPPDAGQYLLDAYETALTLVPEKDFDKTSSPPPEGEDEVCYWIDEAEKDWRESRPYLMWRQGISNHIKRTGGALPKDQEVRYWRIMRWNDEPAPGALRSRVDTSDLIRAYSVGAATLADFADHLLGPRHKTRYSSTLQFDSLSDFTSRKITPAVREFIAAFPEVRELVDRAVARILDLELTRGDLPTAATDAGLYIGALSGIDSLCRALIALGKEPFKSGGGWRGAWQRDRRVSLTRLAQNAFPAEGESPADCARALKSAVQAGKFPEERVLELAFLGPQWIKSIEAYFDWEGFAEGAYWLLAHMRYLYGRDDNLEAAAESDGQTSDEGYDPDANDEFANPFQKKLSAWERLILERTPLSNADRGGGAVDVAWFHRTYERLGDERWQRLAAAARFAANAAQAKRAKFIADVLLNNVKRQELVGGIQKKQLKEYVRLLGLLPLANGKKRDADLVERCKVLREYRRYANSLSGLTKPDALRAWEIGMKNLAQTAGFADPLRLEWAVGAEAVKDLAKGPVKAVKDGVTVSLSLDEMAQPVVTAAKAGKELKSVPPPIKKDKKIAALLDRVADLKRQAKGIKQSLELAMCRGDAFTGAELKAWCEHALLAPLLSRLVVVGEDVMGYPDKGGKALRDFRGKLEPVKPAESLRVAHPHDLFAAKNWQHWQKECFQVERVQPFKQVFRELYVVTKQEKADGTVSRRYAGQQVQPTQAAALFGSRGWNTAEGVFKVFHDEFEGQGLIASVQFDFGVTTPAEVEGSTLAGISFATRDAWKPVKLASVPPRLFSEVMRDLDLVVSVAHAGGVDPEASASTVEMRAGLLRETCLLLKLKNVTLKSSHAIIKGELADYTVHMGSGVVHVMPGGALCIVPVHSQHRGRLFLPFADDDPRTAEVISKVLLLARDQEIQDPTILEQIRR